MFNDSFINENNSTRYKTAILKSSLSRKLNSGAKKQKKFKI